MNQRGFDLGLGLTLGPKTQEMTHPGCDLNKFMGILTDYSTPTTKLHDESKGSFGGEVSPLQSFHGSKTLQEMSAIQKY